MFDEDTEANNDGVGDRSADDDDNNNDDDNDDVGC
jgi:hypothetical protein